MASIRARRHMWVGHILRMEPDRMIHQALFHMHMHRSEGDLLMDTPPNRTWKELVEMASGEVGRTRWRQRVSDIANGNKGRVEITIHGELPRRSRRIQAQQHVTKPTTTTTTNTAAAKPQPSLYQRRDAHEAFFRPSQHPTKTKTTKRSKSKPKALTRPHFTDKQRRQWAREHYELNHQFPTILGHHQPQQQLTPSLPPPLHEQTILPPPTIHSLLQHLEDKEVDNQLTLLQQLDMLND